VKKIFQLALEGRTTGEKVMASLSTTCDMQTTMLAENIRRSYNYLEQYPQHYQMGKEYGLNINVSKIKLMIDNHQSHDNAIF